MNLQSSLETLRERSSDIEHYTNLLNHIHTTDLSSDTDFQREFNYFYKVRRGSDWRKEFYELFEAIKESKEVTFEFILRELYKRTGNVEASFSSKMLANINPEMPIWDSLVLAQLGLKSPIGPTEKRLEETITLYSRICAWYKEFRQSSEWQVYVNAFDAEFPSFKSISDVKKIDFLLWAGDASDIVNADGKEITRVTLKSSSGFCPADMAYEDKLVVTKEAVSYEFKPLLISKVNPVRKWKYTSSSRFFQECYRNFSKKLTVIINRIDSSMYCTDIGAIEFTITYSDKSKWKKEYWLPSDTFADALRFLRDMVPPCEEMPEVLKLAEDFEDEE